MPTESPPVAPQKPKPHRLAGIRPPGPANVAPAGCRLRKAWWVSSVHWDNPEIEYAPTAPKARYRAWLAATECRDFPLADIAVRRAPEKDVMLPEPHPALADLTEDERHCLLHAFGGDTLKAGHRDHFYTHQGDLPLVRLVEMGLMAMHPANEACFGERDMAFFHLTWMGRRVALSMVSTYPRF